jgi:hypothetical protein
VFFVEPHVTQVMLLFPQGAVDWYRRLRKSRKGHTETYNRHSDGFTIGNIKHWNFTLLFLPLASFAQDKL